MNTTILGTTTIKVEILLHHNGIVICRYDVTVRSPFLSELSCYDIKPLKNVSNPDDADRVYFETLIQSLKVRENLDHLKVNKEKEIKGREILFYIIFRCG